MHPTDEKLRAHIDHELSGQEGHSISDHLEACEQCSDHFSELKKRSDLIRGKFELLESAEENLPAPDSILMKIQQEHRKSDRGILRTVFRPVWVSAAALLVVIVAWQFSAVRVWAVEFLNLFRVQQIVVVPIDPIDLQQLHKQFFDSPQNRPRIEQLFSNQVSVMKHGTPQTTTSANAAAAIAGFGVRLPTRLAGPLILRTHPGTDISVQIDVEKLQAILDDAGRGDIRIPEDLDGKYVNFHIPASVTALYGKCPELQDEKTEKPRESMQNYPNCNVIVQLPAPSVVAPPSLDALQLGQAMLQLLGLPEAEARKFSETIDWTSTLVIPLPVDRRMKFSEPQVDGVTGTLFSRDEYGPHHPGAYNLVWIRNGILYSVMGQGKIDEALAIGNSLN